MEETQRLLTLDSETLFARALARSEQEPVVLFKHSAWCGASFRARRELEQLTEAGDPPVYQLVVQEARALSQAIAAQLGIRHETPQAIVLFRHQPVYHASHRRITAQAVRQAVANLSL